MGDLLLVLLSLWDVVNHINVIIRSGLFQWAAYLSSMILGIYNEGWPTSGCVICEGPGLNYAVVQWPVMHS